MIITIVHTKKRKSAYEIDSNEFACVSSYFAQKFGKVIFVNPHLIRLSLDIHLRKDWINLTCWHNILILILYIVKS